jgi:preprotein translocase subunit SecG
MSALLVVQVVVSVLLIGTILLQVGRGASTGAVFGGASGAFFGPTGHASFLGRVIIVLAIVFVVNTIVVHMISQRRPPSLPVQPPVEETVPQS